MLEPAKVKWLEVQGAVVMSGDGSCGATILELLQADSQDLDTQSLPATQWWVGREGQLFREKSFPQIQNVLVSLCYRAPCTRWLTMCSTT